VRAYRRENEGELGIELRGKAKGVRVAALQSDREEETRDRAERGSAVRGSDQASVAAEGTPSAVPEESFSKLKTQNYLDGGATPRLIANSLRLTPG